MKECCERDFSSSISNYTQFPNMASMMDKFRETDTSYTIALPQCFESSALVYGKIDFVRLLETAGIIL